MQEKKLFKAPAKTFLFGEYAVLQNGPAILASFPPAFSLIADEKATTNFHPESPAGKFLSAQPSTTNFTFFDPFAGIGGLGASTAEFSTLLQSQGIHEPWKIWECYRELTKNSPTPPSGADLLAQSFAPSDGAAFTWIRTANREIANIQPKFSSEVLCFLHTGKKLATHEHLNTKISLPETLLRELNSLTETARSLPLRNWGKLFVLYIEILQSQKLQAAYTLDATAALGKIPGNLGAKGCGAMGADIIAAIWEADALENLIHFCKSKGLQPLITLRDEDFL